MKPMRSRATNLGYDVSGTCEISVIIGATRAAISVYAASSAATVDAAPRGQPRFATTAMRRTSSQSTSRRWRVDLRPETAHEPRARLRLRPLRRSAPGGRRAIELSGSCFDHTG